MLNSSDILDAIDKLENLIDNKDYNNCSKQDKIAYSNELHALHILYNISCMHNDNEITKPKKRISRIEKEKVIPNHDENKYYIYTDGGCDRGSHNTVGAWSICIVKGSDVIHEDSAYVYDTTNNVMEMTACYNALDFIRNHNEIDNAVIISDSQYVIKGITSWIGNWIKNNWITSTKEPVKNKELWIKLLEHSKDLNVTWQWVKGHNGNIYNERCDELCTSAIDIGRSYK